MFAYSSNGSAWRGVEAGWVLDPGEVLFEDTPTLAQLVAAFPTYKVISADAQLLADQQAKAKAQLLANDVTASRCKKGSVLYPPEWKLFDEELRAIARATVYDPDLIWPVTPDYPAGS